MCSLPQEGRELDLPTTQWELWVAKAFQFIQREALPKVRQLRDQGFQKDSGGECFLNNLDTKVTSPTFQQLSPSERNPLACFAPRDTHSVY